MRKSLRLRGEAKEDLRRTALMLGRLAAFDKGRR